MIRFRSFWKRLTGARPSPDRQIHHADTVPPSSSEDDAFATEVFEGDQARDRQDWRTAATAYERATAIRPDGDILIQQAHMLKESGDLDGAGRVYEAALFLKPDDADLMVQIGHYHWVADRPESSLAFYRQAAETAPDQPDILHHVAVGEARLNPPVDNRPLEQAMIAMREHRWPEAETVFEELVGANPELQILLGHVVKEQGRLDDAISHYRHHFDALPSAPAPDRIEAAFQLAVALKQARRFSEAALYFNQARFERSEYEGWVGSVDIWMDEIQDCVSRVHPAIDTAAMRKREA